VYSLLLPDIYYCCHWPFDAFRLGNLSVSQPIVTEVLSAADNICHFEMNFVGFWEKSDCDFLCSVQARLASQLHRVSKSRTKICWNLVERTS